MLDIQNLRAGYGSIEALHGVSLKVEDQEIVTVLGPNGAGKSTLLKAIVGLIEVRQGSISFDGHQINGMRPEGILSRGLTLVPEGRGIFDGLTVLENLLIGAYLEKDQNEIDERVTMVGKRFPVLAERHNQMGVTLSGGEQQQLAIARALMSVPKMLLLDEPSLGLAPNLVENVMDLLRELRQDGLTILLVEQNTHQALKVSDRAYVMTSGTIRAEGPSSEFREKGLELERAYLGDE